MALSRALLGYGTLPLERHEGFDGSVALFRGELVLAVVVKEGGEGDVRVAHLEEELLVLFVEMRTSGSCMDCLHWRLADDELAAVGDLGSPALLLRSLSVAGEALELRAGGTFLLHLDGDFLTAGVRALFGHQIDHSFVGAP